MFSLDDAGAHSLESGLVNGEVPLAGKSDRGFRSHGLQMWSLRVLSLQVFHVHACFDGGFDNT